MLSDDECYTPEGHPWGFPGWQDGAEEASVGNHVIVTRCREGG